MLTAHQALAHWADETPDRVFLTQPFDGEVREWTFRDALRDASRLASGLRSTGLSAGDKVAILSKNCAEWIIGDIAVSMAGLVSVPIYPSAGRETIGYVMEHSDAAAIIVGRLDDPGVLDDALPAEVITVAMRYPSVGCRFDWDRLVAASEPLASPHEPADDEVMTILYTSGSTGRPKGVVLTYGAYRYASETTARCYRLTPADRALSYLPLAHVTERTAMVGPAIFGGMSVFFNDSLKTFADDLRRARVTMFLSVPRLWVKFQAGVHRKLPPERLSRLLSIPIVRGIVARRIRDQLGLGHCRLFGSGSAPISPETLRWYDRIGVPLSEGWGMSETCGLSCTNLPFRRERIGTIGEPLPGTEMKNSDDGEILIRSPGLLAEYYKMPELSGESFTDDGYFRTGDKGQWDERVGGFRITGRVKDQFKSAKGKYVSPVPIESKLAGNPLVDQVCVMGTGLRAPVAVVVLSEPATGESRDAARRSLQATMHSVNETLESHEKMSHILIADEPWTIENDLLTPTMKIKRDRLEARYAGVIAKLGKETISWMNGN